MRDLLQMLVDRARTPLRIRVDRTRLRPNDVPVLLGDPSRLRNELAWAATIPLQQTADELLAFWRAQTA
jgi:GDP-D-mannose dehydratase